MMPRKVWGAGSLKHRERPATHNVGLVGVSCCGELWLSFEPSTFANASAIVSIRCLGCGAILDAARVIPSPPEPQMQKPWAEDEDDDPTEGESWVG